jgi:hypothetical protein
MLEELGSAQKAAVTHATCHLRRQANKIERSVLHVPASERDHAEKVVATMAHFTQLPHVSRQQRTCSSYLDLLASRCRCKLCIAAIEVCWAAPIPRQVNRHLPRRRVVKHQRSRQRDTTADGVLQLVAQLHRAERVDARLHQWCIRIDSATCSSPHHVEDGVQ